MVKKLSRKNSLKIRVGLLGGSFNPAHAGHLAISRFALKRLGLQQIWWLVSPQNPLKSTLGMAGLSERLAAARHVAAGDPRIMPTDIESQMGTRYTIDTLRALQKRFPRVQFVWLMGADNMRQLPRWRDWVELMHLVPIAVFRRPGSRAGRRVGKAAIRFDKFWLPTRSAKKLAGRVAPAWLLLDNPLNNLSATEIRRKQQIG